MIKETLSFPSVSSFSFVDFFLLLLEPLDPPLPPMGGVLFWVFFLVSIFSLRWHLPPIPCRSFSVFLFFLGLLWRVRYTSLVCEAFTNFLQKCRWASYLRPRPHPFLRRIVLYRRFSLLLRSRQPRRFVPPPFFPSLFTDLCYISAPVDYLSFLGLFLFSFCLAEDSFWATGQ